jgi:peptidyl-prolyl cis-trans isomerase A (cyclophilin A)
MNSFPHSSRRAALRTLVLASALAVASLAHRETLAQSSYPQVTVHTSMGNLVIELYPDKAPISVENFLSYAKAGFYNGTIFHRVMPNFMIQGGGFTRDMGRKATRGPMAIEAKNGLRNDTGWVAMARTAHPDSATAQFFINVVDNPSLNFPAPDGFGYAVFGKVIQGMEVVNKIRYVATHTIGPHGDVPINPVILDKIVINK